MNKFAFLIACLFIPSALLFADHDVNHLEFTPSLTVEEQAWLQSQEPLRMVYDPDWAPFEWQSPEGVHTGVIADIIDIIKSKTGLNIQVIKTKSWAESVEMVKSGKADFFSAITSNAERAKYLDFSRNDLYSYPAVLLTKFSDPAIYLDANNDLSAKRIGIVKSSGLGAYIQESYPELDFVEVPSTRSGFVQLRDGDIDLFAINSITGRYYLEKKGFNSLKVALKLNYNYNLKIGAREGLPQEAISVLDKGLGSITNDEINNTIAKWVKMPVRHEVDWSTVLKIAIAFSLIIAFLLWHSWQLKIKVKEKTAELYSKNVKLKNSIHEIESLKKKEKENIYRATIHGTQHIIYNLLNQLQLVDLEMMGNKGFSKDVVEEFSNMQREAMELTEKLSSVENIDEDEIKRSIYPK